jgi:hypothetical protein
MTRVPRSSANSCCAWHRCSGASRRATGIETDLLRIQAEIIREREYGSGRAPCSTSNAPSSRNLSRLGYRPIGGAAFQEEELEPEESDPEGPTVEGQDEAAAIIPDQSRQLTHCFLHLANLDNAVFDRLARYESRLWRQTRQTMFALEALQRQRYRFR